MTLPPPRWDLESIYPGLDSPELNKALTDLRAQATVLEQLLAGAPGSSAPTEALASTCSELIERFNTLIDLSQTVRCSLNLYVTTNSYHTQAARMLSEFEQIAVRVNQLDLRFSTWLGQIAPRLENIIQHNPTAAAHAFFLKESAEQSRYLMPSDLEDLAAELNSSGANAWGKLQGVLTSQVSVEFELDGQVQILPLPTLISLHSHPDENVRHRAHNAELKAEESLSVPLAAALNGVKGTVNTLDHRRGRQDALHSALDQARIDRETLEAMLAAMRESFPTFRHYFHAKARRLGKERLDWWDLFAPSGASERRFSFNEARDFILEHFSAFSPELGRYARRAFDQHWIDADPRKGKRGGAFCMHAPLLKESRILCNFDGSLDQVSTIAHELGHGFHADCTFQAGKSELQAQTPMTMAETASILCETIITEASLLQATTPQEQLAILETALIGDAQVIVDIYSRFLFEQEVFERREKSELSPEDLCEIMTRAQKATYGDGLNEHSLHPYMWTWKPHYYSASLSFYNFPYAFGLLFGTGLYAIYEQRGAAFVKDYQALLASTGEGSAAELAARFGIDIRAQSFWEQSLGVIARRIGRYARL